MQNIKINIKKIVSGIGLGFEFIIGLTAIVLMLSAVLTTFVFPMEMMPEGDAADAVYAAAEELGVNEKDFRRYLCVLPEEARMLPGMVESGADPVSATRTFLTRVETAYRFKASMLTGAYGCMFLIGVVILTAAIIRLSGKDPASKLRQKRAEVSEYWHEKALNLRTMAAYLDEGRYADEDWTVPAEGEGWEGSKDIDSFFRGRAKDMEMLKEFPQWYWEMVEGELAVHIKSELDHDTLNSSILRIEAFTDFITTIFRNHTAGPLTDTSAEVVALKQLMERLEAIDNRDTLTKDIVTKALTGNHDRDEFFLSSFAMTDQWYLLMHDISVIRDYYSKPDSDSEYQAEEKADMDSDDSETEQQENIDVYVDDAEEKFFSESETADEYQEDTEYQESEEELPNDTAGPDMISDDESNEAMPIASAADMTAEDEVLPDTEPEVPRHERDLTRALLYAAYLKGVIKGMMTDDRLSSKETTALKALFASWPSNIENASLKILVSPFTETKGRPRVGEVRNLCSALEVFINNRVDSDDAFVKKMDGIEFSGMAKGVIADETISDDDVRALKDWFDAHDEVLGNDPYDSAKQALEDGSPLIVYNTLKLFPALI